MNTMATMHILSGGPCGGEEHAIGGDAIDVEVEGRDMRARYEVRKYTSDGVTTEQAVFVGWVEVGGDFP